MCMCDCMHLHMSLYQPGHDKKRTRIRIKKSYGYSCSVVELCHSRSFLLHINNTAVIFEGHSMLCEIYYRAAAAVIE